MISYMLRLVNMVDDKIHMHGILVAKQKLGWGGQGGPVCTQSSLLMALGKARSDNV